MVRGWRGLDGRGIIEAVQVCGSSEVDDNGGSCSSVVRIQSTVDYDDSSTAMDDIL